mmetsp:Transcript_42607/g.66730  ORF Transcript_42607/g.66730 Transcript_42607/m.66730 type:complete len:249 (-) Transcript_42607:2562-3308(-)
MTAGWLRDQEGMAKDLNTRKAQNLMVLGGLTSEQAVEMLSQASLIKAEEGQELMLEGRDVTVPAEERKVFMVLRGSANVFKGGRLLGTARPGEFLGESRYLELEALEQLGKLQVDVLQDLFDIADTDESGTLDLQEVQEALNSKGLELTLQQTRQIIAGLDADSDGELSMDELRGATLPLGKKLVISPCLQCAAVELVHHMAVQSEASPVMPTSGHSADVPKDGQRRFWGHRAHRAAGVLGGGVRGRA